MEKESSLIEKKIPVKGDDLTQINILSYGIGHFLNDLCAACWFFFLSYYLREIIKIGEYNAGYVILSGQIFDALATPTVGILSDKTHSRIGKRTPWYIGGTILVLMAFTLIFVRIIPEDVSQLTVIIYYCSCASLFNMGWASVQVSHMSLLPQISLNKRHKERMNRIRTGFTFLAQSAALVLSFFYFWLISDKIFQYQILALSCLALGLITSIVFLCLCREIILEKNISNYLEIMRNSLREYYSLSENSNYLQEPQISHYLNYSESLKQTVEEKISWTFWLKKPDFYAYMGVYMFVRLSINITQSVIPFYMEYVLNYQKTIDGGTPVEISIVLLISTIGSIINSIFIETFIQIKIKRNKKSRLIMMFIASIWVGIGCIPMFFLNSDFRYPIYALAFFFGIGFSQGLATVNNLINDVVGSKGSQGAFVYGAYSFSDKLSCGIVLALFIPIATNENVLKYTLPFFPPGSLICGLIIVFLRLKCKDSKVKFNLNDNHTKFFEEKNIIAYKHDHDFKSSSFIDDSRFTFITHNPKINPLKKNEEDENKGIDLIDN